MKSKYFKAFLFGIMFLGAFYLFNFLVFLNTETVCAKIKHSSAIKGRTVLVYSYKYNGKIYIGNFDSSSGICMRLECYEKDECIDVEVSTIFHSMSRIKEKNKLVSR